MAELTCIVCPRGCLLKVMENPEGYSVTGNACPRGVPYAVREMTDPRRMVSSTTRIEGAIHRRLPVKTSGDIPKGLVTKVCGEIGRLVVFAPVACGDVIIRNVLGTGADVIAARTMERVP